MKDNYKLNPGDIISIHWETEDYPGFAYDLRYSGRDRKNNYVFESLVYGWEYLLTADKALLSPGTYDENERKWFTPDNHTGWMAYLPD